MGTWFDEAARIANGLLSVVALVVIAVVGMEYLRLRRAAQRLLGELRPMVKQATEIVAKVHEMADTVKGDVDRVSKTITGATDRVQQAVDLTERRLNEFSALVEVVQKEAEDVFVSSAAVVEGIRAGAAALTGRRGPELASDESDTDDDGQDLDDLEEPDGDSDFGEGTDRETAAPGPRIRPRSRGRDDRSRSDRSRGLDG